jgi:hypothetical protein
VDSADRRNDVPAGTMDEMSPLCGLCCPHVEGKHVPQIGPLIFLIPSWEGQKRRSRREAWTLRATGANRSTEKV